MEFGVRGFDTCGTKPRLTAAYYLRRRLHRRCGG